MNEPPVKRVLEDGREVVMTAGDRVAALAGLARISGLSAALLAVSQVRSHSEAWSALRDMHDEWLVLAAMSAAREGRE